MSDVIHETSSFISTSSLASQPLYFGDGRVLPVAVNFSAAAKGSAIMPGSFGTL